VPLPAAALGGERASVAAVLEHGDDVDGRSWPLAPSQASVEAPGPDQTHAALIQAHKTTCQCAALLPV